MRKEKTGRQHPYIEMRPTLAEHGVVVIDNVAHMPQYGSAYISPDLLFLFCHQGTLYNQNMPDDEFSRHDVGVLFPNQIVMARRASDDYKATMVAVSRRFYDEQMHLYTYPQYSHRFRLHPATHLTDEQFSCVMDAVKLIRTISQSQSPNRTKMLAHLIGILINIIGEYHIANHPDEVTLTGNKLLFSRFYDAMVEHYRESREMSFYARLLCLSPKHFSNIIKAETGRSANEWISTYVTLQAKRLLDLRENLSVQQTGVLLGFDEHAAFSRFFRNNTGMSPTEYRKRSAG